MSFAQELTAMRNEAASIELAATVAEQLAENQSTKEILEQQVQDLHSRCAELVRSLGESQTKVQP